MAEIEAVTAGGRPVQLRFSAAEHAGRLARTRASLRARGLDALLVFAPESHYWLTGLDTSGYVFFQVGVITADERATVLLTRRPDLAQARDASLYDDIRIWLNAEGANPAADLRGILEDLGLRGGRIGIEYATYGLTAANGNLVGAALDGVVVLEDASDIVRSGRLVKSEQNWPMSARPGGWRILLLRRCWVPRRRAIWTRRPRPLGGSDAGGRGRYAGGRALVNSGKRAIYGRGIGGPRRLDDDDQMMIELGASWYRYHVCTEETVSVGRPHPRQQTLFALAQDAMQQVLDHARPGRALGELDDIHRRVLDRAALAQERFAACAMRWVARSGRVGWMCRR